MVEYYSREDVIEFIRSYRCSTDVAFHMEEHLNEIPAADVRPVVHGKWIDVDAQTYYWHLKCSECGHTRSMMSTQGTYPDFCEECGADMRPQPPKEET